MDLVNLRLNRIVVHVVPARSSSNPDNPASPVYGNSIIDLGLEGNDMLTQRIMSAIGEQSSAVEMNVVDIAEDGTFSKAASLVRTSDESRFVSTTKKIANNLARVQTHNKIPDSVLLIGTGKTGKAANPVIVIIKAETQDGFNLLTDDGDVQMELVRELFLTPNQKLYKVGLYVEEQHDEDKSPVEQLTNYSALVYDSNLRRSQDAARYFYSGFLGCQFGDSSKVQTRSFYSASQDTIDELSLSAAKQSDYKSHLYSYLKSQSRQIQTEEFANEYLEEEHRLDYVDLMEERGVSNQGFIKDLSLIESDLKNRSIKFTNGMYVRGQFEVFKEGVVIQEEKTEYTVLRINGAVEKQE
jgi:hypothetical protein